MSLQFSRSMRSIQLDSFRPSRIGLVLAILLTIGLILWFFLAKVTLYEISPEVSFTESGRILVSFAPAAMERIHAGQPAILRIYGGADQKPAAYPAAVFDTPGENQAEIVVLASDFPKEALEGKANSQVDIEVEYITPAELVMRASGRFVNRSRLPLSPQSPSQSEQ